MRWFLSALGIVTLAVVAACAPTGPEQPGSSSRPTATTATSATSALESSSATAEPPASPEPAAAGPCPYLATDWVARTNGQRVSRVRVSGAEPPACFFYTLSGQRQLTVRVYTGDEATATALVNDVVPIERSNPATEPAGWQGGYMSLPHGAVYAVADGGTAVVVHTNQRQSVKAREVVERTIESLEL